MNSQLKGYYRYPTVHGDRVTFVAEDDLWLVSSTGGVAQRLTANLGEVTHPFFSPDGEWLAFIGREEGHPEVYLMPAAGGPARRLTYLGREGMVVGWHDDKIVFASDHGQPFRRELWLYTVDVEGHEPQRLPYGPAHNVSFGPKGTVLGRNTGDPARWKRYRGGTAGEIWIDADGTGQFHKLIELEGNLANPMWIGDRIYFLSDHGGIGNIYSCRPDGQDLKQHTHHQEFYARNASTDGQRVVYHHGADVYLYDPRTDEDFQIEIAYHSPQIQRNRKFAAPGRYLEDYALAQDGSALALVCRGRSFTLGNWEGPVIQQGVRNGVRYRLTRWLSDGQRVVVVSDEGGEDRLELHAVDGVAPPQTLEGLDIGRPAEIKVSPTRDEVVLSNHRNGLIWVNLETGELKKIEQSQYGPIAGFDWSPDGNWVAYSFAVNHRLQVIKVYGLETGTIHNVTTPLLQDVAPAFDPGGKYLYFLSNRIFNPVYDRIHFDLNFPQGMRPYAITLRKDLPSPFVPQPRGFEEEKEDKDKEKEEAQEDEKVRIDFDGIADRVVSFPVSEAIYGQIAAVKNRVFYTVYPVEGARGREWFAKEPPAKACLKVFDMSELEESTFVDRVSNFELSADGSAVACRIGNRLRVIRAQRSPKEELPAGAKPSRKTGWIDLSRIKASIEPVSEW
ncbi:MAG: PD40 domain-containing protein, partial [Anaerolineae bacterium]